jgi:hypothetical protein
MNSLRARMAQSRQVGIVDVTGHLFFGRGAGATGTLFQEAIASLPNVPLHLLLFKPESGSVDPECKRATVFQTLLGEMEANEQTFAQRLNATLHAVGVLNSQRPPEGQVTVRFYSEKPAVRALLLDDAAFIAPWDAREENASLVFLEAARRSGGASLYETFRRHFSRLWSHSTGFGPPPKSASFRAAGSTVVRRAAPAAAPAPR